MNYTIFQPPKELAAFVRFFWVLESETPYIHRSMPDGCVEIIFHYKGSFDEILENNTLHRSWPSGIHGQSQKFRRFTTQESFGIFGTYLYPFALPQLLRIPANTLSNILVDLPTLLGQEGKDIEEQMMLAGSNSERVKMMSSFLQLKLCKNQSRYTPLFSIIDYIIRTKGISSVDELAQECFLSKRQFERRFKEFSGFSPKLYSRIVRFQSALQQYGDSDKSLTDIAYSCGYYDQSHFINDFKEFSGYHPKTYFSGRAEGVEWR